MKHLVDLPGRSRDILRQFLTEAVLLSSVGGVIGVAFGVAASVGLTMASHNSLCMGHIFLAANEAQKEKYLPRLASGKALGAWGLTEPGSGSDAGAARTRAVRKGARWSITGTKTFITQGSVAEMRTYAAREPSGVSTTFSHTPFRSRSRIGPPWTRQRSFE